MAEIEIATRLFRYFVALAGHNHFGRTVPSGISTPTLSNRIKKLETQLHARLVTHTDIDLTDVGVRFLERARAVLREAAAVQAGARQAVRGEVGRIAVGFMTIMPQQDFD